MMNAEEIAALEAVRTSRAAVRVGRTTTSMPNGATHFETLGLLGSGQFGYVYKVL